MECGCFCCLRTFAAAEVIDWIDDGDTPLCPHCGIAASRHRGIAAVLPGVTDIVKLFRLHERRFGPGAGVRLADE